MSVVVSFIRIFIIMLPYVIIFSYEYNSYYKSYRDQSESYKYLF